MTEQNIVQGRQTIQADDLCHNWVITLENNRSLGSISRLFRPESNKEVPRQSDASPKIEWGGTVLLVEDEEMVRNVAEAMLTIFGFSVLKAKDGAEAVAMFRENQDEIRCVLCDINMPCMDGWETMAALRKFSPAIPVILSSGYDKNEVMAGDHPEYPQAFLSKPYDVKMLRIALFQSLANNKW